MSTNVTDNLLQRVEVPRGRIGVFSIGHHPYWEQFPGLKEELVGYHNQLIQQLKSYGVEVVDGGLVDSVSLAMETGDMFRAQSIDLLFCYLATYATSSVALPVIQRAGVGTVLLGLQPSPAMDLNTATTRDQLLHDNVTSLPELSGAMIRAGKKPLDIIAGVLTNDERAWTRIGEWCRVATVLHSVKNAKIGYLGHTYEGMLDMHSDPTMFHAFFGLHVQMLEMCDLDELIGEVTEQEIARMTEQIRNLFVFADPGSDPIAGPVKEDDLRWSAAVAVALDKLVERNDLTAVAYYYRGIAQNRYERIAAGMIVGNSLLTGRGVPMAGEADLKTCVAMLIMDRLGAGGSFAEFHPVDFESDIVLVGHDGPAHIAISDGRPVLRDLSIFHGKRGHGLSVEFKIKTGPVTMLGLTQTHDGRFKFVAAVGESVPGPIPQTGNTNTRVRYRSSAAEFVEAWSMEGPTHHFALGVGDQTSVIEKLARALEIELAIVE